MGPFCPRAFDALPATGWIGENAIAMATIEDVWQNEFRENFGREIEADVDAITPGEDEKGMGGWKLLPTKSQMLKILV